MPPRVPPFPMRVDHKTRPSRSGSTACTTPDFCPATSARLPLESVTRLGDDAKSRSGPFESGQFDLSGMRHALVYASSAVIWRDHRILPVSRSRAMKASLFAVGGSL